MKKINWKQFLISSSAPALAALVAVAVSSLILSATGNPPLETFKLMLEYAVRPRTQVLIINTSTIYYLSAIAVAIGFRMNLFNIGVDGQYRLAAMLAAAFGGAVTLPAPFAQIATIAVAVVVGALWAGLAALLKVTRGISEVISTIMLNFVATALVAWLLNPKRLAVAVTGSNNIGTRPIPESGRVPGMNIIPGTETKVYGLLILAVLVGIGYWFLLGRTRFGFDLRATGLSENAAVASGVNVKKMVIASMMISGAAAGLVGMPQLLGSSYSYGLDFPAGLGFTGIAIALVGRNSAVGIAFAALLFGFLQASSQILDLEGIPKEIVLILQGVMVLSVVIAYELVRRFKVRANAREVGRQINEVPAAKEVGA